MKTATKAIKKIIAVVLCIMMLCSTQAIGAFAATEYTSGNFTYTVSSGNATVTAYPETAKGEVEIPATLGGYPVIAIDDYAFFGCTVITSVKIPSGVKTIGEYAFAYCTSLLEIEIPVSVTKIGKNAFSASNKLADIYYGGTETSWNRIDIASGNSALYSAEISYTSGYYLDDSDIFSFSNSSENYFSAFYGEYYMLDSDFNKLANYMRGIYTDTADTRINSLQQSRSSLWEGSCYGMAAVTVLDKYGHIDFNENFDSNALTMNDVDRPIDNERVRSAINYYFIAQGYTDQWCNTQAYVKGNSNWSSGLRHLVNEAQSGKAMMFGYFFDYGGHEIVIKGYEPGENGDHRIVAYDNRYPGTETYVVVDEDFETCVINGDEDAYRIDFFSDFSGFDQIDIDGPNNDMKFSSVKRLADTTIEKNLTTITFSADDSITIVNAEGKKLSYDGRSVSGNMEVKSERMIVNSTLEDGASPGYIAIDVLNSDTFVFESDSKNSTVSLLNSEVYAFVETDNAEKFTIDETRGIDIIGDDFKYDVSLSLNNDLCDMISVSGESKKDFSAKFNGDGIEVDGGIGAKGITVFSDTSNVKDIKFDSIYDDLLVTGSDSGEVGKLNVLASKYGDGKYDVTLVEESKPTHNASLDRIEIVSTPINVNYGYKSSVSLDGLKVVAKYSDSREVDITDEVTVSNFDTYSTGNRIATVEYEGHTAEFEYSVEYSWWQWILIIVLFGWIWY